MGCFPEDRSGAQGKTFETETLASPILGLQSNLKSHNLEVCRSMGKVVPAKITQRNVLSQVTSMFDPLGLFFLFTVRMWLVLKGIWKDYRKNMIFFQGLIIGVESDEGHGYQKKVFIGKC